MTTPRQLIICCDGTSNNLTGGLRDTNVVKLTRLMGGETSNQLVHYDPGVGNPGALPGVTIRDRLSRDWARLAGLAFGRGVYENVAEAYEFLMDEWKPGDEIYVLGFSRGAFTARCIAGMVNMFGVMRRHMRSMVPTLLYVYFADRQREQDHFARIVAEIRETFCSPEGREAPIQFVGVWDTVASVGMPPFNARITARPQIEGKPRFRNVRQALALDEHRAPFKPRAYTDPNGTLSDGQTMDQRWFRGSHCDVGGGYPVSDSGISDMALAWLADEATKCRLRLHDGRGGELKGYDNILAVVGSRSSPLVHSELYSNCLWAVAGLTVRNPASAEVDDSPDVPVPPVEHESVERFPAYFPRGTVWEQSRTDGWTWWGIALVVGAAIYFAMAYLLSGEPAAEANLAFAKWQLLWWSQTNGIAGFGNFDSPRWALTFDFAFIGAYAYLLAFPMAYAFAKIAGLRRADSGGSVPLSILGRSLLVAVLADIVENIAAWLLITFAASWYPFVILLLGYTMSIAMAVSFAGIAGVVALLGWSVFARTSTVRVTRTAGPGR